MDGQATPIGSTSSGSSSRAIGFEFDTCRTPSRFHIPLESIDPIFVFYSGIESTAFPVRLRCMARADYD